MQDGRGREIRREGEKSSIIFDRLRSVQIVAMLENIERSSHAENGLTLTQTNVAASFGRSSLRRHLPSDVVRKYEKRSVRYHV